MNPDTIYRDYLSHINKKININSVYGSDAWDSRTLDLGTTEFIKQLERAEIHNANLKRCIQYNNLQIPFDGSIDSFLQSIPEPDFLQDLEIKYPEFFI